MADFKTTNLSVPTGGTPVVLDFDGSKGALLKAEGYMRITVSASSAETVGRFWFRKAAEIVI